MRRHVPPEQVAGDRRRASLAHSRHNRPVSRCSLSREEIASVTRECWNGIELRCFLRLLVFSFFLHFALTPELNIFPNILLNQCESTMSATFRKFLREMMRKFWKVSRLGNLFEYFYLRSSLLQRIFCYQCSNLQRTKLDRCMVELGARKSIVVQAHSFPVSKYNSVEIHCLLQPVSCKPRTMTSIIICSPRFDGECYLLGECSLANQLLDAGCSVWIVNDRSSKYSNATEYPASESATFYDTYEFIYNVVTFIAGKENLPVVLIGHAFGADVCSQFSHFAAASPILRNCMVRIFLLDPVSSSRVFYSLPWPLRLYQRIVAGFCEWSGISSLFLVLKDVLQPTIYHWLISCFYCLLIIPCPSHSSETWLSFPHDQFFRLLTAPHSGKILTSGRFGSFPTVFIESLVNVCPSWMIPSDEIVSQLIGRLRMAMP